MKKCFKTLLVTGVLSLLATTTVFAHDLIIEGEEKTGKKYPTESNYYLDSDENGNEVRKNVTVHLIPKNERFRVSEKDYKDGKGVAIYYVVFGNRTIVSDGGINSSTVFLNDYLDSLWYEPGVYYDFTSSQQIMDFINEEQEYYETGLFPVVFEEYSEYDWTMSGLDPYIFKLVDAPLLSEDKEEEPGEPEENPTASDSNTSRPSGGSSGGSSSSTRKGNSNNTNNSIAGNWKQDSKGWWFEKLGGGYAKNEWIQKDGIWYHFDESGYMQTGWIDINGIKYFLNPNGAMVSNNWSLQDNKWYFFDTTGAMKKGWQEWKGKWYYFNNGTGEMLYNVTTPDGYNLDSTGAMVNN